MRSLQVIQDIGAIARDRICALDGRISSNMRVVGLRLQIPAVGFAKECFDAHDGVRLPPLTCALATQGADPPSPVVSKRMIYRLTRPKPLICLT